MKKKILGIFDRRPLIWFHYVLLTLAIYVFVYYNIGLNGRSWWQELLIFYLIISISDQLIHRILKVD